MSRPVYEAATCSANPVTENHPRSSQQLKSLQSRSEVMRTLAALRPDGAILRNKHLGETTQSDNEII